MLQVKTLDSKYDIIQVLLGRRIEYMSAYNDKVSLLTFFRSTAEDKMRKILRSNRDYKKQASMINTEIKNQKDYTINEMMGVARRERWSNEQVLDCVLHITYASYVVMLEYRNQVWPYEYMAFARRIGELWEPFCKETFAYSVKPLRLIDSPDFNEVQDSIKRNATSYINSLAVDSQTKRLLHYHYSIPWKLVDSGGIQLGLDLHFSQNGINYNCDFKSGFSSNEKGNTNRLLLVASIYRFLSADEKTVLFVRQNEDDNNHYLQTLKNSGYWDVFCAEAAYEQMYKFTGFDLRSWLDRNATWVEDISDELRLHLEREGIIKYLTW